MSKGDITIKRALRILEERMKYSEFTLGKPKDAMDMCRLRLADLEHEVFAAMWLDSQNRMIEFSELFRGTINQTSVYPREIVKEALRLNAAAVIFAHNHPSGLPEPSSADIALTKQLDQALKLVDVRVLDHIIVGATCCSMAERGLI